jgi:hypothetical protein
MTITNRDRAQGAHKALEAFRRETKCDYEDSLGDLLRDLMHFGDVHNFDFEAALIRARDGYAEERAAECTDNFMNIRCRECGNADKLDIEIVTWARLTDDGTDIDAAHQHDHEWDDNCLVHCDHCGHFETLGENSKPLKRRRPAKKGGAA